MRRLRLDNRQKLIGDQNLSGKKSRSTFYGGNSFNIMNHIVPEDQNYQMRKITMGKKLSSVLHLPSFQDDKLPSKRSSWIAWLLLLLTFVNGATTPCFFMNANCNPLLKSVWRLVMSVFLLLPFMYNEYKSNHLMREKYNIQHFLQKDELIQITMASIGYALWKMIFIKSLSYTTVSHTAILTDCHVLIIAVWKLIKR